MVGKSGVRNSVSLVAGFFMLMMTSAFHAQADAEEYELDPTHTSLTWTADHFGFSHPSGKFTALSGRVMLDEQQPENSHVAITIDTASVLTGIPKFDEHLRSADFFDVKQFGSAAFTSDSVVLSGADSAKVAGKLTLHGVTRPVTLDVKLNKIGENPVTRRKTAGFTASTRIRRSDFNMNYALPGVADEVKIHIETEAVLVAPAK